MNRRSGPTRQANNDERTNDGHARAEHVGRCWLLTFNEPQPDERRGDVDATVGRVGSSREGRIDTRQCNREADEAEGHEVVNHDGELTRRAR